MMPQRITPFIEIIFGLLTISSTLFTGQIVVDLVVGILVYFTSRFLYRKFGARLYKWLDNLNR